MSEDADEARRERQKRQIRLLGAGTAAGGLLVVAASFTSLGRGALVPLFGFLGIAVLILERTQGTTSGASFGLLTAGLVLWLAGLLGPTDLRALGGMLVLVGLVNVAATRVALYFRRLGEKAGERTRE